MAQKRKSNQTKTARKAKGKGKSGRDIRGAAADAALSLAVKSGWDRLSLSDVAKSAKLPQKDVAAAFKDSWDILAFVLKRQEDDTKAEVENYLGDSWRDNLMEILMMRFEKAQPHRDAYAAIGPSALRDPRVAQRFGREFFATLSRMLTLAGLERGRCQPLFVAGFGALYLSLVDTWLRDKTPDMSHTMAAIDKRIGLFERLTNPKEAAA